MVAHAPSNGDVDRSLVASQFSCIKEPQVPEKPCLSKMEGSLGYMDSLFQKKKTGPCNII